jgi:hypothetical protein
VWHVALVERPGMTVLSPVCETCSEKTDDELFVVAFERFGAMGLAEMRHIGTV